MHSPDAAARVFGFGAGAPRSPDDSCLNLTQLV
jgi:hypothetical protein